MAEFQVHYFSNALGMCVASEVILPQYENGFVPEGGHKVLYLLHGRSDNHTVWGRRTSLERYASQYGLAVVLPNGHLSRYANMAHGGRYYDYIARELPEIMGGFFPLSVKREDHFIAGLSMGGAGALKIGLSNPEAFSAIGCLSAGMNNIPRVTASAADQHYLDIVFGDRDLAGTEEDIPFQVNKILTKNLPAPRIFHSCGAQDPFLPRAREARDFFRVIPDNPFDYTYQEAPGTHNWEYWDEHIRDFLAYLQLPPVQGVRN